METVHIITAISRPENIDKVCRTLVPATMYCKNTKFVWHWIFDIRRSGIAYAHQIKNQMVDDIQDGWVWILDDDTSVHPDIFLEFEKDINCDAFVVCQKRADGRILIASPENNRVDHIDSNQAIIRRSTIGDHRMTEDYAGDGYFLEAVLKDCNYIRYSDKILCYHNML